MSRHGLVGVRKRVDEEVMGGFDDRERNLEDRWLLIFQKALGNTYFQKREERGLTYKSGGRRTQVDYILWRQCNLKEIEDCKVVTGECVARQHQMCRIILVVRNSKRVKVEQRMK